ncbi:putative outer membrane protein [Mesorhizobium sp. ORS 3359]|nr:putative outer membrane protein [Mesorhizobium sp. ORS 3359]
MVSKAVWAFAAVFAGCVGAVSAQAKSDGDFLKDAIKGDNSEVMLGKLAQKNGGKAVKSFGHTLQKDHAKAKRQAAALARKLGVDVPGDLTDEAIQEQQKLQGLSGAAFDNEFAPYMVSDHQKDVSEFEDEAKSGQGDVANLAKKTLPTLRKHLKLAQSLEQH